MLAPMAKNMITFLKKPYQSFKISLGHKNKKNNGAKLSKRAMIKPKCEKRTKNIRKSKRDMAIKK